MGSLRKKKKKRCTLTLEGHIFPTTSKSWELSTTLLLLSYNYLIKLLALCIYKPQSIRIKIFYLKRLSFLSINFLLREGEVGNGLKYSAPKVIILFFYFSISLQKINRFNFFKAPLLQILSSFKLGISPTAIYRYSRVQFVIE